MCSFSPRHAASQRDKIQSLQHQLADCQSELADTQSELADSQAQVKQMQEQLSEYLARLLTTQEQLHALERAARASKGSSA